MRIKLFRIGKRDLHCILSRGVNQLGQYVTAHSTTIPEGARVHHLNISRSGMYLDVWMEHESFPELKDYDEPAPENANFTLTAYKVVGKNMVLDNLTPEELATLRDKINLELSPDPYKPLELSEEEVTDFEKAFERRIDQVCVDLGIPKRVFVGSRLCENEMEVLAVNKVSEYVEKQILGEPPTATVTITVGDKVRLNSGGPLMEVLAVNGDQVLCEWTKPSGLKEIGWFGTATVVKSSDDITDKNFGAGLEVPVAFNATTLPNSEWIGEPRLKPIYERIRQGEVINAGRALHPVAVIDMEAFMRD